MWLASRCQSMESALSAADWRVLQLLSQRRSSVAVFILADDGDCFPWLSEGHSGSDITYLVKVLVVGGRERGRKVRSRGAEIWCGGPCVG